MSNCNLSFGWEMVPCQSSSKAPSAREGAICAFVPEKNSIIIFGGQNSLGSNRFADLFSFDTTTNQWTEEKTKGLAPPSLSHAACWFDFPYLFFQGGRSNQDKSLSDTYFLDVETFTWRKLFTMEQPSSRYGHKAIRNDDKQAYVFGGCNIGKKEHRFLNDLHKCEYKSIKIVEGEESNVNGASWITNVACKGVKPPGRKGHSMILINNNIFLFGGELKQGITDETMYKFSIDDKEWSSVNFTGDKLSPNAYSCLMQINNENIVIIGGKGKEDIGNEIYSIDIKTNECVKRNQSGNAPDKRADYMSCINKDNNIILFGGSNNEGIGSMELFLLKESKSNIGIKPVKEMKEESTIKINQIEKFTNEEQLARSSFWQQGTIQQPQIIFQSQQPSQLFNQIQPQPQPQSQSKQSKTSSPQTKTIHSTDQQSQIQNQNQKIEAQRIKSCKEKVMELKQFQIQFIKLYEKNFKATEIYHENLYKRDQHQGRDTECTLIEIERAKQTKEKDKENEKANEIKELNILINDSLNLHKRRVSFIMELLCAYVEDMRKIDKILLKAYNTELGLCLINYDVFNEKRNNYSEQLKQFFQEFQVYSRYEIDLHNNINKKMNEKREKSYIEGDQNTISFREGIEGDQIDYNNN